MTVSQLIALLERVRPTHADAVVVVGVSAFNYLITVTEVLPLTDMQYDDHAGPCDAVVISTREAGDVQTERIADGLGTVRPGGELGGDVRAGGGRPDGPKSTRGGGKIGRRMPQLPAGPGPVRGYRLNRDECKTLAVLIDGPACARLDGRLAMICDNPGFVRRRLRRMGLIVADEFEMWALTPVGRRVSAEAARLVKWWVGRSDSQVVLLPAEEVPSASPASDQTPGTPG